jgi:hypothetical protein
MDSASGFESVSQSPFNYPNEGKEQESMGAKETLSKIVQF